MVKNPPASAGDIRDEILKVTPGFLFPLYQFENVPEWTESLFSLHLSFASVPPLLQTHIHRKDFSSVRFSSVQLLSHVQLFVTSWTEAHQASLSITNSQSLLKLISIKSVMPSNHLILCHPLLLLPSIFPSIRVFSKRSVLRIRCQSIGASASVLPMNIQD